MSELLQFFKDMRDNGYGLAEIAAQLGTSAIAEPVAGFAAMYDPFNRESSNLLATTAPLVPTTALGAYMYNENRKKSQGNQ